MFRVNHFKKAVSLSLVVAMISSVMIGLSIPAYAAPVQTPIAIYRDTNYTFAERAADMVARMTLAQKAGRLV